VTTTLLVALDGSEKDARAPPVAAALAELSGADTRLVHVADTTQRVSGRSAEMATWRGRTVPHA